MASARSSNTFNCMLQTRVKLINAYMAACRLRDLKSELVKDLYIVQATRPLTKQQRGGKGKPARPRGDQKHKRRSNRKSHRKQLQKWQGKEKATRPRESHQGNPYRGAKKRHYYVKKEGPDDFPFHLVLE